MNIQYGFGGQMWLNLTGQASENGATRCRSGQQAVEGQIVAAGAGKTHGSASRHRPNLLPEGRNKLRGMHVDRAGVSGGRDGRRQSAVPIKL